MFRRNRLWYSLVIVLALAAVVGITVQAQKRRPRSVSSGPPLSGVVRESIRSPPLRGRRVHGQTSGAGDFAKWKDAAISVGHRRRPVDGRRCEHNLGSLRHAAGSLSRHGGSG